MTMEELTANKQYWELLIPYFDHPQFNFIKIKGHSDNEYNNLADKIAVAARSMKIEDFSLYLSQLFKENIK